jgi:hypothetical protein
MDRAYRYGQVRDVYVYRLLGAGALEGESESLSDFLSRSPITTRRVDLCAANIQATNDEYRV